MQGCALLYVYGAYGLPLERHWEPKHEVLLGLGWTLAYAHVRGGAHARPATGQWLLARDHGPAAGWLPAHGAARRMAHGREKPSTIHCCAGGCLGKHWHLAATGAWLPKRVEDLRACLASLRRHLGRQAAPPRVVLHATSAGGITAGALLNADPEVCCPSEALQAVARPS